MKRKARIQQGAALNTPDEELDMLALVTPEDVADAQAIARQRMTARGAALLETAREEPPTDEPLPLGA